MKTFTSRLLLGTSIAASVLAISNAPANAKPPVPPVGEESTPVACDVAVFSPDYDACVGSIALGNGENDVTSGDSDDILTKLLNDGSGAFGADDWTFLGKDDGSYNDLFNVSGIGATSGSIIFDVAKINSKFGGDFLTDYDVAISFKSAKSFSVYKWDAALNTNTINWETDGTSTNDKGEVQALSHASVYFRKNNNVCTENCGTEVPEPASVLGLMGLSAAALKLRRK